ncbi:MAG: hypothetical protein K2G03_04540, partial [Bacilli bacterium]|nr:hypothetical protein [Bacilli bacterium]
MKIYADKEFRRHKENKVSTILSKKLLEEIVTMEENKKKSSEILNKAYKFIENKNYEEAKKLLEDIKIYLNAPRSKRLCKYLLELCQTILDFQKDETLILSDCKNYDFSEDISIARAFSTFMQNKDYLSANMYIDKCCELYKGGFYRLARILLEDLLDINKHHCFKTPPKNEIQELRIKTLKDDSKSNIHFSHFLGAMQNLDFDKAYEEIKLNLRYKVNAHTSSYTNSYNIYTMLKFLREMQESGKTLEEVRFVYLTNDSKQFNFNRAIRMQDWHSAYKFIPQEEIEKSLTLEAQYLLLKAIFRQDKINRGLELTEADELKPLSSHLKKDNNEEITKILTPKEEKVEVEKKEDVITIEISEEDCEKGAAAVPCADALPDADGTI